MRVLLQHIESRLYYGERGSWTASAREAFDFQLSAGRPELLEKLALRGTRLVVDSGYTGSCWPGSEQRPVQADGQRAQYCIEIPS